MLLAAIPLAQVQGIEEMDGKILVIDSHIHVAMPNPLVQHDRSSSLVAFMTGPPEKTAEQLVTQMEEAHIGMVLLMGQVGVEGDPLGSKKPGPKDPALI